jgi:hypothetical protein
LSPGFAKTYLSEKVLQVLVGGHPELYKRVQQIIDDEMTQLSIGTE